jgi:hypothetical protein
MVYRATWLATMPALDSLLLESVMRLKRGQKCMIAFDADNNVAASVVVMATGVSTTLVGTKNGLVFKTSKTKVETLQYPVAELIERGVGGAAWDAALEMTMDAMMPKGVNQAPLACDVLGLLAPDDSGASSLSLSLTRS